MCAIIACCADGVQNCTTRAGCRGGQHKVDEDRARAHQIVWDTLRSVDVTGYAETLGRDGTHFVSWSRVWAFVKGAFPSAEASTKMFDAPEGWKGSTDGGKLPFLLMQDGSAAVDVRVSVSALGHIVSASCLHPVGSGMKVAKNPDLAAINKATRRAMVKACALLGLGLELWTDEGRGAATIDPDASRKAAERLRARLEAKAAAPAPAQGAAGAPGGKAEGNPKGPRRADLTGRYAHIAGPLAAVGIDPENPAALASLAERAEEDGGREVEVYERAADSGEHPCDVVRGMCNPAYVQAVAACESAGQKFEPPPELSNVRPSLEECDDFFAMLGAVAALESIATRAKEGQV